MVETCLVNPLAKILIKEDWSSGDSIVIEAQSKEAEELFDYYLRR